MPSSGVSEDGYSVLIYINEQLLKIKCNQKEDYFKSLSQRDGVYFCCFIGFDEELLLWEKKLEADCQKNGVSIHQKLLQRLNNPDIHSLHVHLVTSQHPFTQKSHPFQKYGQSHPYLSLLIPFA